MTATTASPATGSTAPSSSGLPTCDAQTRLPVPCEMRVTPEMAAATQMMQDYVQKTLLPATQNGATLQSSVAKVDMAITHLEMWRVRIKSWHNSMARVCTGVEKRLTMAAEGTNAQSRDAWVYANMEEQHAALDRTADWLALYDAASKVLQSRSSLLSLQASGLRAMPH